MPLVTITHDVIAPFSFVIEHHKVRVSSESHVIAPFHNHMCAVSFVIEHHKVRVGRAAVVYEVDAGDLARLRRPRRGGNVMNQTLMSWSETNEWITGEHAHHGEMPTASLV